MQAEGDWQFKFSGSSQFQPGNACKTSLEGVEESESNHFQSSEGKIFSDVISFESDLFYLLFLLLEGLYLGDESLEGRDQEKLR